MIEKMEQVRGLSPWILKDFLSPRRPLAHIRDYWNRKGLLSESGIKKKAWYVLHDWYQEKNQVVLPRRYNLNSDKS
jgi:beta-glucuronidase